MEAMAPVTPNGIRRHRDELVQRVHRAEDTLEVFAETSARLRRLVPFDSAVWLSTDPDTGLPTAPTRLDDLGGGLGPDACSEHWRREFLMDDVILFRDLGRADRPAGSLRASVSDPRQSGRYRNFLRPKGFEDELRAVLRIGDATWGSLALWRASASRPFTTKETELVAGLSSPIAEALRSRFRPTEPLGGLVRAEAPGVLLFDRDARLVSVNDRAREWLDEVPHDIGLPSDFGIEVPIWMHVVVLRAGAIVHGNGDGTARTRVRTNRGLWLTCHASCLRDAHGSGGHISVALDAAKPAAIAPIIVEAFDLTTREQQIARLIARGLGTSEIAAELFLSVHTVRDYVKVIFQKVEVSSRGELVAKLFAEFYEPAHLDAVVVGDPSS
jgi:DNA-binding CsgD family transcriptional regulator